jgi:hypothetical protein
MDWSAEASAKQRASALVLELPHAMPLFRGFVDQAVTPDIFLTGRKGDYRLRSPYESARLLTARLVGLGDMSQIQLERLLKRSPGAKWRVREWETVESRTFADSLPQRAKKGMILFEPAHTPPTARF